MKKKLISMLTLLLVCLTAFSAVSAAPAEWQPDKQISPIQLDGTLAYQVILKANIGTENANKPVVCRVISASDSFSDLTESDLVYFDHVFADALGNVSITFTVEQYGDFQADFRVQNGETSQAVPFTLLSETDAQTTLNSAFATGADTIGILKANKDELNLDFTYFDKLSDTSGVVSELTARKAEITPYNLTEILEQKVILEYIKKSSDKLDISKMIDAYEEKYLGLSEQKWENIYETYLGMTDTQKAKAMSYLQSYAPATISEIADDFNQAIIFAAIDEMDKFDLHEVIRNNNDLLGLTGYGDLDVNDATDKAKISDFLGQLQEASLTNLASVSTLYTNWKNPTTDTNTGGAAISSPVQGSPGIGMSGGYAAAGADSELFAGEQAEILDIATSFLDLGDVPWAETAIRYLCLMEIVNGKEPRKFYPNDSITREEFIKIIVGAFDIYDETATCNFTDIPEDHWAYPYVASAVNKGLVFGVSATEFGAGQNITREDMATLLYRMVVKLNDTERIAKFEYEFKDMDQVSDYANYGVLMLYHMGYIQGDGGKFYPKNTATRAESAQMVYNIMMGEAVKPVQEGGSAE